MWAAVQKTSILLKLLVIKFVTCSPIRQAHIPVSAEKELPCVPASAKSSFEKALVIFYREGFHAAGMDLLSEETGISKTTMFKHFRTKEDLILAVLRLRDENFRNWLFRRTQEGGSGTGSASGHVRRHGGVVWPAGLPLVHVHQGVLGISRPDPSRACAVGRAQAPAVHQGSGAGRKGRRAAIQRSWRGSCCC